MGNSRRITPQEFAQYIGVDIVTVYRWLKRRIVPGQFKIGGRWRIDLDSFEQHFNIHTGESNENLNANPYGVSAIGRRKRR